MRPPKLTQAVQDKITQAIGANATVAVAVESTGITERTFYNWMEKGQAIEDQLLKDDEAGTPPETVEIEKINGSYYYFTNGERIRGKVKAHERLKVLNAEQDYYRFFQAVKKARANSVLRNVAIINNFASGFVRKRTVVKEKVIIDAAGKETIVERETTTTEEPEQSWQAAAWLLERRHPADFSRIESLRIQNADEDLLAQRTAEHNLDEADTDDLLREYQDMVGD